MRGGRKRLAAVLATMAVVGGLVVASAAPASAQTDPEGEATGLTASLNALIFQVVVPPVPHVTLPPGGSDSLVNLNAAPVATAGVLNVASNAFGAFGVTSSASVLSATVLNGVPGLPSPVLGADAITSECTADENGASGDADVVNATVLGGAITLPVGAPPNTVIPLPLLGSITLNEQERSGSGIRVRSLHLEVNALGLAAADVVLAESACFPFGDVAGASAGASATAASATGASPNLSG